MPDVIISPTGVQGPRGNSVLNGHGAPASSLGVDGDFYVDNTTPTALVIYGPKTAGAWGSGQPFGTSGVTSVSAADTSIVVGGTASAPTLHTATLDVIAADRPAAADWSNNGHKITSLANGTAASDAAAFGQIPATPWLFNVANYGAVGDGQFVTDGAMSSGSAVLTSASGKFTSGDVGKAVMVKGAGATGVTTLVTTIASYQSATQVTLTASNASGGAVSSALVMWATDDTTHIQNAINAALAYAGTHGSATVYLPTGSGLFYGIAGALVTGTTTKGNSQLTLGAPVSTSGNKTILNIEGVANGSGLQHWQQLNPQLGGSTLVSFGVFANATAQTNSINANGNAAVIGGPAQPAGYGQSPGLFSNMLVTLRNLSILTTHSSNGFTYTAADFSGIAEANLENIAYGTTGSVAAGDYSNPATFGSGLAIGLLMPANGNNDNNVIRGLSVHGGYTYALFATEHTVIDRLCILYCWAALCVVGAYFGSVGSVHGVNVVQASIEQCSNIVYVMGAGSNGIGPWLYATISTESGGPTFSGSSAVAMNAALGTVTLTGEFTVSGVNVTNPTGLKIVNGQSAYPVTAINSSSQTTYTVSVVDQTILVDTTTAAVTVTLISAAWTPNTYTIVNTGTHALTIATTGGQTINGASTLVLSAQWQRATVAPARVSSVWGWYQTA
jgi:hypothetical protein